MLTSRDLSTIAGLYRFHYQCCVLRDEHDFTIAMTAMVQSVDRDHTSSLYGGRVLWVIFDVCVIAQCQHVNGRQSVGD